MKRVLLCLTALLAGACNDFDKALAECRAAHRCEDSTRAPTLVQHSPEDGASGLPAQTRLSLTFDEPMARTSVKARLTPAYELGEPTWSEGDTRVSFPAPPADLEQGRTYTVTVEGSDIGGAPLSGTTSFQFTTRGPPDTTPPTVTATQPVEGATGFPLNGGFTFTFSERMNPDTTSALLTLTPATGCTYTWQSTDTVLLCQPVATLQGSTQYSVSVNTALKDVAGNPVQSFTLHFTTAAAPDTTPPVVASTTPASSATGVDKAAPIVITFSEAMERASVEAAFQVTAPAGATGAFTWDAASKVLTFTPSQWWPWGGSVQYRIGTGAKDLAGNPLAAVYQNGFTVEQLVGPVTLTSVAALDGYTLYNFSTTTTSAATGTVSFIVGDDNTSNWYRGFLTFDLSQLPAGVTVIGEATLVISETAKVGSPQSLFGLFAESVNYGASLTGIDWDTPTLQRSCTPPCSADLQYTFGTPAGSQYSLIVTDAVQSDLDNKATRASRSQFRIRRGALTNQDAVSDQQSFAAAENSNSQPRPKLLIKYEAP